MEFLGPSCRRLEKPLLISTVARPRNQLNQWIKRNLDPFFYAICSYTNPTHFAHFKREASLLRHTRFSTVKSTLINAKTAASGSARPGCYGEPTRPGLLAPLITIDLRSQIRAPAKHCCQWNFRPECQKRGYMGSRGKSPRRI